MDKGLYTLEDGEIVPEPTLSETPAPPSNSKKVEFISDYLNLNKMLEVVI